MASYSTSEIQHYLRCRRAWDLTSQNRKGLVRTGIAPAALQLGSAVHAALDAQAKGHDPIDAAKIYFQEEEDRLREDYYDQVGMSLDDSELDGFRQTQQEAIVLVYRYFEHYGWEKPLGEDYRYIETEITFEVPIPGTKNKVIGTFDGIAEHIPSGTYWLVEHKTYSMQPKFEKMETDWQLSVYCYAAERLFNKPLRGVLYDGIAKKVPKIPELLTSGRLSKAANALAGTDFHSYMEAIKDNDLDPLAYEAELSYLKSRDSAAQTPFFTRWRVELARNVLLETEHILQAVTREMSNPDTPIIPNFRWEGCYECNVRDICRSIQFGEDTEFLIQQGYKRGEGHATVKRMSRPRFEVSSIADLERAK